MNCIYSAHRKIDDKTYIAVFFSPRKLKPQFRHLIETALQRSLDRIEKGE